MTEGKTIIGNVCFITNTDTHKILLLKRSREPMQNLYTGVGGKTHFDEDIRTSCFREVQEETGLEIHDLALRGVVKTILSGHFSAWILFVYTARTNCTELADCPEGSLEWIDKGSLDSIQLIGFIKEILSHILYEADFLEGTIVHDNQGNVLDKNLSFCQENWP